MAWKAFQKQAAWLQELLASDNGNIDVDNTIETVFIQLEDAKRSTPLWAALCVLADLARQRWSIRVTDDVGVEVRRPAGDLLDPLREKARIRAQEQVKRDEQLREPATRSFIQAMERRSIYGKHFVSIFSLMRDGRELAQSLRKIRNTPHVDRIQALRHAVDPYLQFIHDGERCEHTGLRLQDIWRYFRHTWVNQYTSTPGRSMCFLVRDRAREFHPVIGIGSLGSPIVQIRERDAWIGWHPDGFMERVSESPTGELGEWLNKVVQTALGELFLDDFFEEQIITPSEVRFPSTDVVVRLADYGARQRELHHRLTRSTELKHPVKRDAQGSTLRYWQERARSHLYRSKRALALADMLRSRLVLRKYLSENPTTDEVRALLLSFDGRRIVKSVLRKAKADRVGIAMADITVCGALAPYNALLGGKLVSMLAASPSVIAAYRERYIEHESEIASAMAGRSIVRPSQLVFLSTTSLYGIGSSQYNRLSMPAARIGGAPGERFAYQEIGKSDSYGTSHFSSETVDALVALIQQSSNGQRVNSIFGEGVSPKLRKIRAGLEALNLPADALLQHGRKRLVYGVSLVRNLREFLLGMEEEPRYIFNTNAHAEGTEEIVRWWTERWLSKRIRSNDVLSRVEIHTLVRPVRHGARVVLPPIDEDQASLFDDLEY